MVLKSEQDVMFEAFEEMSRHHNIEDDQNVPTKNLDKETEDFIIDKIKDALIEHNYNQTHASKSLGIKRTTFIAKCKKFGIFNKKTDA